MIVLISGPTIAALTGRHRMSVNDLLRGGKYGETVLVDGIRYAAFDRVQQRHGVEFSDEQINAAVAGLPGRILRIPEHEEVA
ncbi:MAG: hypothetical protein U1E81_16100 [Xanthobacteraceae bacterium]